MRERASKPKKKRRIWLYILSGFLLIILGIAGFIFYELILKTYDVADPEVDKIIEENYVIELPDGEQLIIDKDGNVVEEKSTESNIETQEDADSTSESTETDTTNNGSANVAGQTSGNNQSNNTQPNNPEQNKPTEKPTVASIKARYMPTLEALQAQANSKINGLVEQAKSEYVTKKSNGESISFGYFYNKYTGAADTLEASTDIAFNSIIQVIENELERNGYSKEHAASLREDYKAQKEERKNSLLNKALELL